MRELISRPHEIVMRDYHAQQKRRGVSYPLKVLYLAGNSKSQDTAYTVG